MMRLAALNLHPVIERELRQRAAALRMTPEQLLECCIVRFVGLDGHGLTQEQAFGTKPSIGNKKEET